MNDKQLLLVAQLLEDASDEFANHGCNDFDFPESWTEEDKREFVKTYHDWNGDPYEYDAEHLFIPDYAVMSFLAHLAKAMANVIARANDLSDKILTEGFKEYGETPLRIDDFRKD